MRNFDDIKDRIAADPWRPESIGTAAEQSVHRAIKYWLSPDPTTHEVRLCGKIADVFLDGRVYEIQTRGFAAIAGKIGTLLEHHPVTVVYPVVRRKTVYAIGADGTVGRGRVSPKRKRVSAILAELHGLRGLVAHPRLDFLVVAFDATEYRSAALGSTGAKGRIDLYPRGIPETHRFRGEAEFAVLMPAGLPDPFTVKDLAKGLGMNAGDAGRTALFLRDANLIALVGKAGRAYLYKKSSAAL